MPRTTSRKSRRSRTSRKTGGAARGKRRQSRGKSPARRPSRKAPRVQKSDHIITAPQHVSSPLVYKRPPSRATTSMSRSDLEFMAKSLGIPFGGLSKEKLVRKINHYVD